MRSLAVAFSRAIGLHVVHHRDLGTSHGKWTWPTAATNMNMTLVQMAAAGVCQVCDWRPTVEHHFGSKFGTYHSPQELLNFLEYYRDEWQRYEHAVEQQRAVLVAKSSYADRFLWIAKQLGIVLPVCGDDGSLTLCYEGNLDYYQPGGWDPIPVSELESYEILSKPGLGAGTGPKGTVIL